MHTPACEIESAGSCGIERTKPRDTMLSVTRHAGQRIGGKYRLEHPIADGGMGSVWLANHEALGCQVAVKFIAPLLASDATARARFEREAKLAARLQSPHVVQVLDYGVEGAQPFITMEYLAGKTLERHLAEVGALPLARAAELIEQIAKAVGLAHAAGIVHRDLKPSNIFLAEVGSETVAKVGDFGIAKQLGAPVDDTTTGTVLGSPHAMSPEQARGGVIDHRSDLWSLGVIAFRMITGHRPFDGANLGDVLVRICTDPIPRASQVGAFSLAVDEFFARAFERDVTRRFASARELAEAFTAVASDPSASIAREVATAVIGRDTPTASLAAHTLPAPVAPRRRRGSARGLAIGAALAMAVAIVVVARGTGDTAPVAASDPPPPTVVEVAPAPLPAPRPADPPASEPPPTPTTPTTNVGDRAPKRSSLARKRSEVKREAAKSEPRFDPFSGLPLD